MFGDRGHGRYHAGRLQGDCTLPAEADTGSQVVAVAVLDGQSVRQEQQIELAALQSAGDVLVVLPGQKTIRRVRMPPRPMCMSHIASREETGQMQLSPLSHRVCVL